jgi:ADP-ribosyl-[dinitrogen reductase] hydrolase
MDKRQVGRGAILGALIGDAAGATLEFKPAADRQEAKQALTMVGGGHWRTAPGQITDDGEMALSLMAALVGTEAFAIERVAQGYLRWFNSLPFDMGVTTRNGINGGFGTAEGRVHEGMWAAAAEENTRSKANGALMRVAPLGVWGYRLTEEALVEAACQDARLTHANETCQYASAVYCLSIRYLMNTPGDSAGAISVAERWAGKLANPEIAEWLELAARQVDVGYSPRSGFVKYGFTHAFRHLAKRSRYLDAMLETLMGGGDTDTNACIVGGMVGALHGEDGIPQPMVQALLKCDTSMGRPRPDFLQTKVQLPILLDRLIA